MTTIKKSGAKEEFLEYKLSNSIDAANRGTDESLNLKMLMADFYQIAKGRDEISTREIMIIVYGLLYEKGLVKTLESYSTYEKN